MTTGTPRTVFFEVYSPLQVMSAWRLVRGATDVAFSRRTPFERPPRFAKRVALALIRLLNPSARVRELTVADLLDYLPLNAAAVAIVDEMAGSITRTPTYRITRRLIEDHALVRYYQAAIVRAAPNWTLFPRTALRLAANHCAIADWDTETMSTDPASARLGRSSATASRRFLVRWRAIAAAMAVPGVLVARALARGFRSAPDGPYQLALPVIWGIADPELREELARPHSDDYVYGSALGPGDVVHLFGDWPMPAEQQARFQRAMDRRGLVHADRRAFKAGPCFLRKALKAQWIALSLLWRGAGGPLDDLVLRETPKAIYHYLRKHLEHDNVWCAVHLVRDDYNPGHVVAAIACRERGVRTVATQHNALPFEGPQLAFVTVDRLAVFGEFYRKGFRPAWDRIRTDLTGRESLDWTVAVKQGPRLEELRRRWGQFRGDPRPTVLVVLPGDREICIPEQWNELYRGLEQASAAYPEFDVVLRFRSRQSLQSPHVQQFERLYADSPRFVAVWKDFTTYELMAISDLVISHDGSFTVNESIALGVPTMSFEFVCAGRHYFADYGKDFVLSTAADVVRAFAALERGFTSTACDWVGLARDLNAHTDGGNRERLRKLIEEIAGLDRRNALPAAVGS